MMVNDVTTRLVGHMHARGYQLSFGALAQLPELQRDLETVIAREHIDADFVRERLAHFNFAPEGTGFTPVSFILVAAHQPQQMAVFHRDGKDYRCLIPPTYADNTDTAIEELLRQIIGQQGFSAEPAAIPLKLAAVRTGLARYGKNNLTYCDGLGSYFRLKAFVSDLPVDGMPFQALEMMPQCEGCTACLKACPTGAIGVDQFPIRAERCLTYFNERPDPFPAWVDSSWHRCLIGCMMCQSVCPLNKDIAVQPVIRVHFSETETSNLLETREDYDISRPVREKLEKLSLWEDWRLVARNLKVFIQ